MISWKILAWSVAGLLLIPTVYLGWMNRASEKVATNLPTALAVGLVGALVTLIVGLQPEVQRTRLAVEYVVDPTTGFPFSSALIPEIAEYTDAGGATTFRAWLESQDIQPEIHESLKSGNDLLLAQLYRRVLLRQILQSLRFTFIKSWDAEPTRFALPTGGGVTTYSPRAMRPGRTLSNDEIVAAFGGDTLFASDFLPRLNLPPKTNLEVVISAKATELTLSNPFVKVTLRQ